MSRALHDMGGDPQWYGPVTTGVSRLQQPMGEPPFHDRWEGRVFALALFFVAQLGRNADMFRDTMERLDRETYLSSYFARWLAGLERVLVKHGWLEAGAVDARLASSAAAGTQRPLRLRSRVYQALFHRIMRRQPPALMRIYPIFGGYRRFARRGPHFGVGDSVFVVAQRPPGHTRVPGYLCGHRGRVVAHHGAMVLPDVRAINGRVRAVHLYTVAFAGSEVWGADAEPGLTLHADLFETYLEAPGE